MSESDRREYVPLRFRKRPVVIEAIQYRPDIPNCGDVARFVGLIPADREWECDPEPHDQEPWLIETLEGAMRADAGDWIIRGVQGEFYPCKNEIFLATYEPANADVPVPEVPDGEAP